MLAGRPAPKRPAGRPAGAGQALDFQGRLEERHRTADGSEYLHFVLNTPSGRSSGAVDAEFIFLSGEGVVGFSNIKDLTCSCSRRLLTLPLRQAIMWWTYEPLHEQIQGCAGAICLCHCPPASNMTQTLRKGSWKLSGRLYGGRKLQLLQILTRVITRGGHFSLSVCINRFCTIRILKTWLTSDLCLRP